MPGKRLRAASWSGLFGAVLVAGLLTGGTAAYASTTWIVDNTNTTATCNNNGALAGTQGQPFCTIYAASHSANLQAGDTVLVQAGTYNETQGINPVISGTASSPITFTANQGVTISGGKSFALSGVSYITINGFTITGTSSAGISVSGGGNVTISSNTESYAGQPISSPAAGISLTNVAGGSSRAISRTTTPPTAST